jgi:hypothetical protein
MHLSGVCNRSAHKGSHDVSAGGAQAKQQSEQHVPYSWMVQHRQADITPKRLAPSQPRVRFEPTWLVYVEQVVAWLLVEQDVA